MATEYTTDVYPLHLTPLLKDKVWGATRLERWFPGGAAGRLIGEVWAIWADLPVENGPYHGARLADLVRSHALAMLGSRLIGAQPPHFPLLVKFVDTCETLSVQVHPADDYAQRREGQPFGKAEMWYVIDAEPGACLYRGVTRRITRAEAEQAIATGTLEDVLDSVQVVPGDVIMNQPGTIHALGPGLLLYELQQSSDLTYRLYDWNRNLPDRPLHLDKALDVAHLEPCAAHKIMPVEVQEPGAIRSVLCATRWFALERLRVQSSATERPAGKCFHMLTVLQGAGTLETASCAVGPALLKPGQSLLVPAAVREYEVRAAGGPLVLLKGYVPDLLEDIVEPLRRQGCSESQILQLAGFPVSQSSPTPLSGRSP